ncbi:MAG: GGDEF domain-containing protein, partial [Desulfamplus sp.]|nr:GGDEF domain-containing protein [Desulfamplus sp.]
YGHDVGDKVLRKVAETMRESLRETDILGRIGGEEFAVAMPETDIELSFQAAERLRVRFTEVEVEAQGKTIGFTASMGISHLTISEIGLSEMIKKADFALYEAKNSGRNRVVMNKI